MRSRSLVSNLLLSVWVHLSVAALAGMSMPELFEDSPPPADPGEEQAGASTEIDGDTVEGQATDELVPVSVAVLFDDAAPPPVAAEPPAPPTPPTPVAEAALASAADTAPAAAPAEPAEPEAKGRRPIASKNLSRPPRPPRPTPTVTQRRAPGPPCEPPPEEIAQVADGMWSIERELVEFYATHINELMKQGSVWTHKGKDGKPDGFRVGLSRCSVVKQAGLRSGDVVHRINDRRIHNIPQAIAAYFDLRNDPVLEVYITRQGKPLVLSYELEQPERAERRELRRANRKEMKEQLRERRNGDEVASADQG